MSKDIRLHKISIYLFIFYKKFSNFVVSNMQRDISVNAEGNFLK